MSTPEAIETCRVLRGEIKVLAAGIKELADQCKKWDFMPPADKGEMIANSILAYRHLEDGAMRLGKCIQAAEGGVSVYDK